MDPLRFAIFGTGFWARFQLPAWKELSGVECVALYNRTRSKAEELAQEWGIPAVYDDPEELLRRERPDFIDVITDVDTHPRFVALAAEHGVPVICQKPMAPTLHQAEAMTQACRDASVPYFIHENWRWQTPLRQVKRALDEAPSGRRFGRGST
jgi:predicted dehydrogenase